MQFVNTAMRPNRKRVCSFATIVIGIVLCLVVTTAGARAATWYVRSDTSESGDGTSWAQAFMSVQEAVNAAAAGDEIWVQEGRYLLDAQITVDKVVAIYGGFDGSETALIQRDWTANRTIIDGQESVRCVEITGAGTLDGLVITGGSADFGAGVLVITTSGATIRQCTIEDNYATNNGGGIYCTRTTYIEDCLIRNNAAAYDGGGIYTSSSDSTTIRNSIVSGNHADRDGGGIFNADGFSPLITHSTISGNQALTGRGGGIHNSAPNRARIVASKVIVNSASYGGGIYSGRVSGTMSAAQNDIINCVIANNHAYINGGGFFLDFRSNTKIINCTIAGNKAGMPDPWYNGQGGGIYLWYEQAYAAVMNSIFQGNVSGTLDISFTPIEDVIGSSSDNLRLFHNSFSVFLDYWHNAGPYRFGNQGLLAHFVDYNGPDGEPLYGGDSDYRLTSISEMRDQGLASNAAFDLTAPADDLDGTLRPQGEGIDLGAFEFVVTTPMHSLTTQVIGGNGTLQPESGSFYDGTIVALTAAPATGYRVLSWSGTDDDTSTATTNAVTMDGNRTVSVVFEPIPVVQYALTASVSGGNGTVSPESGSYDEGAVVTLTAVPNTGYRVASWSNTDDDTITATTNTVRMDGNRTVSVAFEPIPVVQYNLSASVSGGNGTVSPESGSFAAGTVVNLTAVPDSGYRVSGWSGTDDDSSTDATNTVTMDGQRTVTVTFEPVQYSLTVQIDGQGSVTVSPAGGMHDAGTVVTLTAEADPFWVFDGWAGDVTAVNAVQTTVVMDADQSVTVTFASDADGDGIPDYQERGPDGNDPDFDGNGDGIPDWQQAHVVSGYTAGGDAYVTVEFPEDAELSVFEFVAPEPGAPAEMVFPWDCFRFEIDDLNPGDAVQVKIFLPPDAAPSTYYKYGSTPANSTPHWYEFLYDEATETGADIEGNEITLHLRDGARGDDDLMENGVISDPGGPAVPVSSVSAGTGGGSSGCFIGVVEDRRPLPVEGSRLFVFFGSAALLGLVRFIVKG